MLTTDNNAIITALKKSKTKLIEFNSDNTKLKRSVPIPDKIDASNRTIYAKGFPADSTIDSIESFWSGKGKVQCVRLRRKKDKTFKGSCFIEFSSEEEANNIIKQQHTLGDVTIITMLRNVYTDKKKEELKKKKEEQKEKKGGDKKGKKKRKADGQPDDNDNDHDHADDGSEKKRDKRGQKGRKRKR